MRHQYPQSQSHLGPRQPCDLCIAAKPQEPSGDNRAARVAQGEEWSLFEVSAVLLAGAAPLLFLHYLHAASAFVPELGPTTQASDLKARKRFGLVRLGPFDSRTPGFCCQGKHASVRALSASWRASSSRRRHRILPTRNYLVIS